MLNNTSKILPYTQPDSLMSGVILPHSDKVLSSSDIDKKIEKTKSHISHLNGSLAHRNTHGGKRFRAKNISIKDLISSASKRLVLLESAKTVITKLDQQSKSVRFLNANSHRVNTLVNQTLGLNLPVAKSYREGQSATVFFAGKMRTITVIHATY